MRLDKFLKVSRLIKRRTIANEACDAGRVLVNDKPAKASLNVKAGDMIEIQFGAKAVKVEVLDVQETVKKDEAKELYRYTCEKRHRMANLPIYFTEVKYMGRCIVWMT